MVAELASGLAECAASCVSLLAQIPRLTALKNINVIPEQSL